MIYDYNLLVSHEWPSSFAARHEILNLLREFGDPTPRVEKTLARGLVGVRTALNNRDVITLLKEKFSKDPLLFQFTFRWTPIDAWSDAAIDSMKNSLFSLRANILPGDKWMMRVEKRRYTAYHKLEIIKELALLIEEKVDLRNPDKIVWIEIVGNHAGMAVLKPDELFSVYKMRKPQILPYS